MFHLLLLIYISHLTARFITSARFPLEFENKQLVYASLPFILPFILCLGLLRLQLSTRSSRSRIESRKQNASYERTLIHLFSQVERVVEDNVVKIVDSPDAPESTPFSIMRLLLEHRSQPTHPPRQPILSTTQRKIATSLNAIPQLKKEIALIENVKTAHAIVVCRNVKRDKSHEAGRGVVRHWADHFIL